jgi:hypothetical protein
MAAGSTYTPIATNTVSGSSTVQVTFSSISGSYTDLILVMDGSFDTANDWPAVQVNGDTGSNYSYTQITSTGALSYRGSALPFMINGGHAATANTQVTAIMQFQNYSNTTTYKTMLSNYNDSSTNKTVSVNLWRNTDAINSIKVYCTTGAGVFNSGTTLTIYGIAAA